MRHSHCTQCVLQHVYGFGPFSFRMHGSRLDHERGMRVLHGLQRHSYTTSSLSTRNSRELVLFVSEAVYMQS